MDKRLIWAERVAGWKSSGLTSREYCEGKPFTAGGLRHWAYRLRGVGGRKAKALAVRIAKVVARPELGAVVRAEMESSAEALFVEVGAVRVGVRPGFDRATLAAVIDVLAGRRVRS
jgi:hypothetical protein